MKLIKYIFGIIILVLSTAFVIIACDNGNNPQFKTYTVTFYADNGTENTTQTVTEGNKAIKPTNPTKNGFEFVYWFNEENDYEWDFEIGITENITLKAKWNIQSKIFTVTFIEEDGGLISTQNITEGNKAIRPVNPPRKNGYAFYYWYCEKTREEWDFRTVITENINLKANWEELADETRTFAERYIGKWEVFWAFINEITYETSPFGNFNTIGLEFGEYYLKIYENGTLIDQLDYLYSTDNDGFDLIYFNTLWAWGIAPFGGIQTIGIDSITIFIGNLFSINSIHHNGVIYNCEKVSQFSWE
jgi:uncharacterized repeat protein (TIGR02543 family)